MTRNGRASESIFRVAGQAARASRLISRGAFTGQLAHLKSAHPLMMMDKGPFGAFPGVHLDPPAAVLSSN